MEKSPKVTVVMPVFNGEKYIREAIDSIIAQTFVDFELLIINDGSTDKSVEIVESYHDGRIRLVHNEKNLGLATTRNRGLELSQGEYVATLDCDDVAYPTRLEKQVKFLDKHPDHGLLGSFVKTIDQNGNLTSTDSWKFLAPPEEIPIIMFFINYFAQSATMIRKSALPDEHYRLEYLLSEDLDLWIRIAERSKVWNLPETLVKYRVHGENISIIKSAKYKEAMPKIYASQLDKLGVIYTPEELEIHYKYCDGQLKYTIDLAHLMLPWFVRLHEANLKTGRYDKILFLKALIGRWILICKLSEKRWWLPKKLFWSSPLVKMHNLNMFEKSMLIAKTILQLLRGFKKILLSNH